MKSLLAVLTLTLATTALAAPAPAPEAAAATTNGDPGFTTWWTPIYTGESYHYSGPSGKCGPLGRFFCSGLVDPCSECWAYATADCTGQNVWIGSVKGNSDSMCRALAGVKNSFKCIKKC
ncbi:hypothetical protein HK104_004044 [Borealophlyctis nickersoniae]|nr:hypothetical protein HK104_004044 [Borealophlyctis nickersoniae]